MTNVQDLWNMIPCRLVNIYWQFQASCCLYLHDLFGAAYTTKTKAARYWNSLRIAYQLALCHPLGVFTFEFEFTVHFSQDFFYTDTKKLAKLRDISEETRTLITKREERKPTRCNNIDDLLSIVDVDYWHCLNMFRASLWPSSGERHLLLHVECIFW